MDKPLPEKIADRYLIKGTIGSGGMGVVLLAHDPKLGIDVAIKMLQKEATEKAVARLQREAMVGGKLSHQYIGKVFDFGQTEDGTPYMVMEYFKGQTLSDLIHYKGHLSFEEAKPILTQLCEGLLYAHHQGVVHRDLKPSNTFLARQGQGINAPVQVKLLDFGVAKIQDHEQELTGGGSIVGSPLYMSPELAEGQEADSRSDIYSLGCLMFETLTGKTPFQGKTVLETVSMHRNSAPPLISEELDANNDVPKQIEDLVDRCLRKSPDARIQDVSEIVLVINPPEKRNVDSDIEAKPVKKSWLQLFFEKLGINPVIAGLVSLAACALLILSYALLSKDASKKKTEDMANQVFTKKREDHLEGFILDSKSAAESISVHPFTKLKTLKAEKLVGDEEFKRLAALDFQALDISDSDITGVGLNYVKDKKNLVWIKMRIQPESRELLRYACNIKALTYMEVITPRFNEEDFSHIARLKNLEQLAARCQYLSWKGFSQLRALPKLICVSFDQTSIYDHYKVPFAEFPALKQLLVIGEGLRDDDLSGLAEAKNMEVAKFRVNGLTDKVIEYFYQSACKLNIFCLLSNTSSSKAGELLSVFPILQRIELGNGRTISAKSAQVIASRPLLELNLEVSPVNDQIISILSKNKSVYWLTLGKTNLTDAGYKYINQFVYLILLHLKGENFSDQKIKEIAKCKVLGELDLSYSNINDKQLMMLADISSLRKISLNQCKNLSEVGLRAFRKAFKQKWNKEVPTIIMETELLKDLR